MRHTDTIRLSQKTASLSKTLWRLSWNASAFGSKRKCVFADTVDPASLISGGSPAPILSSLRPGARTFGTYIAAKSRFRARRLRLFP